MRTGGDCPDVPTWRQRGTGKSSMKIDERKKLKGGNAEPTLSGIQIKTYRGGRRGDTCALGLSGRLLRVKTSELRWRVKIAIEKKKVCLP